MPDNFTHEGESAATQWVKAKFQQMEILKNNYVISTVPGMELVAL